MTRSDRDIIVDVALNLTRCGIEVMASCPRREVAKVDTYTLADKSAGIKR
ncbi:hypothetical protein [Bradyrhizobium vignae]|nr:hypothetical protein [Bradyrhizobium vignae]